MENILVVERKHLLSLMKPEGIQKVPLKKILGKIEKYGFYKGRGFVENDPNLKQPIPYLLLKKGNFIFTYKRMPGGGEKRLHNLISIGVGGHMRKMSDKVEENLYKNLYRELEEEMVIETKYKIKFLGILNEDFTPVCQVHLGLVFLIEPEEIDKVYVKEKRELEGKWMEEVEVEKLYED
ncbi:MAG: hypothetical protein WHV67_07705, partial [Thermoanaerobaculia bacterium]